MREQAGTAVATALDVYLAEWDVLEASEIEVGAAAGTTYRAIMETDLRDPVIEALFRVPGLANRMARRLAGLSAVAKPGSVTFGRITAAGRGWTKLAEVAGRELVLGVVSRFWRKDRPARAVGAEGFASFAEPGWARVVLSFSVEPLTESRSVLRYEARAAATDDASRRRFRRHWRVIRPGVTMALRRALSRIRTEAEWGECLTGALADR